MSSPLTGKLAAIATGLVMGVVATAAHASTIVDVKLWDHGASAAMSSDLAYGTPIPDKSAASMGITATPDVAAPGIVKFNVTNTSADTIHEMIVIRLDAPGKPLTYIPSQNRVDEDKVGDKGEVSELDPGASGSLSVVLAKGDYLLICNVPGHYAAGMWTTFTVR